MSALLNLEGISKRFGYLDILENINFSINSGEFVMLVGNNGAGKSTLLRIITSLMRPTKGKIFFQGTNQKDILKTWFKKMGYISEENRFYGDLSPIDNLRLYGSLYQTEKINYKIGEILSKIDLNHVAELPVRNFSSGMKKRLMIGRLMLYEPEILLLDEPYGGLDRISFRWFQSYLREFKDRGGTIIMVTHQFELGLELANRVVVLHKKKIMHDMQAEELNLDNLSAWLEE